MLIGSFYSRYVSHGTVPAGWSRRVLAQLWPQTEAEVRLSTRFGDDKAEMNADRSGMILEL